MTAKAASEYRTSTKGVGSKSNVFKIEVVLVDEQQTVDLTPTKALENIGEAFDGFLRDYYEYKDWAIKVTPSTHQEFEASSK